MRSGGVRSVSPGLQSMAGNPAPVVARNTRPGGGSSAALAVTGTGETTACQGLHGAAPVGSGARQLPGWRGDWAGGGIAAPWRVNPVADRKAWMIVMWLLFARR